MVQIETNEDSSSLSHSQMEPGNNNTKRERKPDGVCVCGVCGSLSICVFVAFA